MSNANTGSISNEQIVRTIGLILSNTKVYGPAHCVTQQSIMNSYAEISPMLQTMDISVRITDADLYLNETAVDVQNAMVRLFCEHLEARDISNFSIRQGITQDRFHAFVEVLTAQASEIEQLGGFSSAISAVGLSDAIGTRQIVYRAISEDEVVVDKETFEKAGNEQGSGRGQGSGETAQAVIAFLRGDVLADESHAAGNVRDMGGDVDQLAELIMHSALVRPSAANLDGGETLGELIVGALNRTYEAFKEDPAFNTQKAKKQLQKTLVMLENDLVEKMRNAGVSGIESDIQQVQDTIETLGDDLAIEGLTQEYARKRNAVGQSEKRLLRYLRRKGEEAVHDATLRERMIEGGLAEEDWKELLVKSGITWQGIGPGGGSGGQRSLIREMARLLEAIEHDIRPETAPAAESPVGETDAHGVVLRVPREVFDRDLHAVQDEIHRMIERTEKKIQKLVETAGGPLNDKNAHENVALSRKQLFEILAEIGQELCQTLSVIRCIVDMLRGGRLGKVSGLQCEMLDLSIDGCDKLNTIIQKFGIVQMLTPGRKEVTPESRVGNDEHLDTYSL